MKPNTLWMRTVLVAAWLGVTVPLLADGVRPGATPKPPAVPAAPAAQEKKPQEEPKIAGLVIPRAKGGFLGLTLENSNFKLAFYDGKKAAGRRRRHPRHRAVGGALFGVRRTHDSDAYR